MVVWERSFKVVWDGSLGMELEVVWDSLGRGLK